MLWDSINIANENWLRRHDAKVLKHFSQSMDRNPHFPRNSEPQAALARLYGMLLIGNRKSQIANRMSRLSVPPSSASSTAGSRGPNSPHPPLSPAWRERNWRPVR